MSAPAHLLKRLFFLPFLAIALLVSVVASAPPALAQADPLDGFVEGDDVAFTEVDEVVDVDVMDNDFDDDDDLDMPAATMEIIDPSVDGEAEMVFTDDEPTARFVPNAGFEGLTKFRYRVCFGGNCFTFWVWIFVGNSRCTITGTNGDDVLVGTAGRDVICGRGGADTIDGKGGNDIILGGKGADVISGGGGNDRVWGGKGADTIEGNGGNDRLRGGRGADVIKGGNGNDRIFGGRGVDDLKGNSGDDLLVGRQGSDVLHGGDDNDTIRGGRDADQIHGGKGADDISGGRGADLIDAGNGSDTVRAGRGQDLVWGGNGADDIRGNRGADVLFGGAGNDTVSGGNGSDKCSGETLTNCEAELAAEDPSVTIATPADGATVDPAGFTIELAVEPAGPPVEVFIDGDAVGVAEAPDYTLTVIGAGLAAGSHLITVETFFGSAESEIVVGTPAIAIATPAEGDPVDATGFDVAVLGGDGTPVDVSIDGTPVGQAVAPDYVLALTGLTLTEGVHVITATDGVTTASTNVVVPTLTLVSPVVGDEVGTDGFDVAVTLDPPAGPVAISVDGVPIDEATAPDYTATLSGLDLAVGDHTVEVSAFGITRTVTVTVPADPVLEIIAPVPGPVANGDSLDVQLTVIPQGDPIDISIDGVVVGQALAPDYTATLTGLGLTAGDHTLSVAGNGLTAEVVITVPVVSNLAIVSPAPDEVVSADEITIVTAGAAGDPVEVSIDGVVVGSASAPTYSLTLTGLALVAGGHTISASDPAGGEATVDVIVPTLSLVSPIAGALLNVDSVEVVASLSPAAGPVDVLVDGEILGTATAPDYTVTLTNIVTGGGTHTISVEAYGLTDSAEVSFPTLAIIQPATGTLVDKANVSVALDVAPATSVALTIDGVSVGSATAPDFTVNLNTTLNAGEHSLTATANGETRSVTFIVGEDGDGSDPPAPVVITDLPPVMEEVPDGFFDPDDINAGPGADLSDRSDATPVPLIPLDDFVPLGDGVDVATINPDGGAEPLAATTVTEEVTANIVDLAGVPATIEVPVEAVGVGGQLTLVTLDPAVTRNLTRTGFAFDLIASGFGNDNPAVDAVPVGLPAAGEEVDEVELGLGTPWIIRIPVDEVPTSTDDQRERLEITLHLGCDAAGLCRTSEDLDTTYDAEAGVIEAAIPVGLLEGIGGPLQAADPQLVADGLVAGHATAGGSGTNMSVSTGSGGAAGDYSATEIGLLTEWQVGIHTGEATTSYPINAPAAPGPVPSVSLSYSSGSVDGITDEKNSQVSEVGAGWNMPNPAITRLTDLCNRRDEPSYRDSLCLPAGQDDGFSISMAGVSGRLVLKEVDANEDPIVRPHPFVADATYIEYETETKNTARIWKVTANADHSLYGNGGAVLEWWEVTTGDGTLNVFGRNATFTPDNPGETSHFAPRTAPESVPLQSTRVVPTYLADTSKADTNLCDANLCATVISWHLDNVIDATGNLQIRAYRRGLNHYKAYVGGRYEIKEYTRSVSPAIIDYGQRYGQLPNPYEPTPDVFRVRFDYAYRNAANNGDAPDADFIDTPTDLLCTATKCSEKTPAFFNNIRLHVISTWAGTARGTQTVLRHSWPEAPGTRKNAEKMFLENIQLQEGAAATNAIDDALPMITYVPEFLQNVVNAPGSMSPMNMPRIGTIETELGGAIKFTYGQPRTTSLTTVGGQLEYCGGATSSAANPAKPAVRVACYMFPNGGARWFNKYVVTETETDADGDFNPANTPAWNKSANELVTYDYLTEPDWAWASSYEDQEVTDCSFCPWSSYRGHRQVRVTDAAGNITDHYTYTGMAEDPWTTTGSTQTLFERLGLGHPTVGIPMPVGTQAPLYNTVESQGQTAAVLRYAAEGDQRLRDASINRYDYEILSTEWPTSSRMLSSSSTVIGFAPGFATSKWTTESLTSYDTLGRSIQTVETGDNVAGRRNHTVYTDDGVDPVDQSTDDVPYFRDLVARSVQSDAGAVTVPDSDDVAALDVTQIYYDNLTLGAPPTVGLATKFEDRLNITNLDAVFNETTSSYDERGLVLAVDNGDNGVTSSTYDPSFGFLTSTNGPIVPEPGDPDDETFYLQVKPELGFVGRIDAPNGQTTLLTSDGLGRTQTVKLPGAPKDSYKFTYDLAPGSGPLKVRTDVLREPDATAYEYTSSWSFMDGFARTIQSQSQTQKGGFFKAVSMNYDNAGRSFRQTVPTIITGIGGLYSDMNFAQLAGSRTTYDTAGTTTLESMNSANAAVNTARTQAKGLYTVSTDRLNRNTTETYDVRGNMVSAEDAEGNVVDYTYDLRDRLLTITDAVVTTEEERNVIRNVYDTDSVKQSDSPLKMIDPDLGEIVYTYDTENRMESKTDALNSLVTTYDEASRPVNIKLSTGQMVSEWTYDGQDRVGLLTSSTHHNLRPGPVSGGEVIKTYFYDSRLRPTFTNWRVQLADGSVFQEGVERSYRESGQLKSIAHGNEASTALAADERDVGPSNVGSDYITTSFSYGPDEKPLSIESGTQFTAPSSVASGASYNARGQLTFLNRVGQTVDADPASGGLASTYSYEDWSGRLLSADTFAGVLPEPDPDPLNTELVHLYRGLLLRDEVPSNAGYQFWEGQLATNTIETIAGEFMLQLEWTNTETAKPSLNPDTTGTFDVTSNAGFVNWLEDSVFLGSIPAGETKAAWVTALNANKNPLGADPNFVYPNQNRARGALAQDAIELAVGNSAIHYVSPEPQDPDRDANADLIRTLAYDWDAVGNLDQIHEFDGDTLSQFQCFSYDVLDRLTEGFTTASADCETASPDATGPGPFDVAYTYDPIGNITSARGVSTVGTATTPASYTYDVDKVHAVIGAGGNNYGYDAVGNQTSRNTGSGIETLGYDVQNRLVTISGAGADMEALYDAEGNRVYRNLDGVETFYFGSDYQVSDGVSEVTYSLGGQTVGHLIGAVFTAASSDHLGSGSVTLTADAEPVVQRYTPFGVIRGGGINGLPVDETFTGQTDDPGTGLIDYNARHYDPQIGRFIMADEVLDGYNRYSYVDSNPLKFADPTGNESCYVPGASMGCAEKADMKPPGPSWYESVAISWYETVEDFKADNPNFSQKTADGAAGFFDGFFALLGEEAVLSNLSLTEGKYDPDSWTYRGGQVGGTVAMTAMTGGVGNTLSASRAIANGSTRVSAAAIQSSRVGIGSANLGNSAATLSSKPGLWNQPGRFIKVGWSGATTRLRAGEQWTTAIRIGIGRSRNPNQALIHLNVPFTHVSQKSGQLADRLIRSLQSLR